MYVEGYGLVSGGYSGGDGQIDPPDDRPHGFECDVCGKQILEGDALYPNADEGSEICLACMPCHYCDDEMDGETTTITLDNGQEVYVHTHCLQLEDEGKI